MEGEDWRMDPILRKNFNPGYDFSDNGLSRKRLSWLTYMRLPIAMEYSNVDTSAHYIVRVNGMGECLLRINGQRVAPSRYSKEYGEIKEFPVPEALVKQGQAGLNMG